MYISAIVLFETKGPLLWVRGKVLNQLGFIREIESVVCVCVCVCVCKQIYYKVLAHMVMKTKSQNLLSAKHLRRPMVQFKGPRARKPML